MNLYNRLKLTLFDRPSRHIPSYNEQDVYFDSDLQYPNCQIGVREVAALFRSLLSGEIVAKLLSGSRLTDCIPGDLFEIEAGDYSITFFIDDPGTFDYIQSVAHKDGRSTWENCWFIEPDSLLSEFEQVVLQINLENLY